MDRVEDICPRKQKKTQRNGRGLLRGSTSEQYKKHTKRQ